MDLREVGLMIIPLLASYSNISDRGNRALEG
jgi:hypothetical protein